MDTIKEIIEKKSNVYYIGGVRYEIAPQVQQCIEISDANYIKQISTLRAEVARLTAALDNIEENVLRKIEDWANAYPDDVFIEPTPDQWKAADKLLKEHGMSMTAITGSAARHCVEGIKSYAKRGMEIIAALESEAPNDSTKPKKTITQREWDLRHANPYDLSNPYYPKTGGLQ